MTISIVYGASATLTALVAQANADGVGPVSGVSSPDQLAAANAVIADYVNNGNRLNNYTQAQTDAAAQLIAGKIKALVDDTGGSQLPGDIGYLEQIPASQQNTLAYGFSINGTTLTAAQDFSVLQAYQAVLDRIGTLQQSGAITTNGAGQQVATTSDGQTVLAMLGQFGSGDPTQLLAAVGQWQSYSAALDQQDLVSLSPTAQALAGGSSPPSVDQLVAIVNANFTAPSNPAYIAAVHGLVAAVNDTTGSYSLADQTLAFKTLTALEGTPLAAAPTASNPHAVTVAGPSPLWQMSASDRYLVQNALSESAFAQRVNAIANTMDFGYVGSDAGYDQTLLSRFTSLSPQDQQIWFTLNLSGSSPISQQLGTASSVSYASVSDYVAYWQARYAVDSIVDNALSNKTLTWSTITQVWDSGNYGIIQDPFLRQALQLSDSGDTSPAFTAQVQSFLANSGQSLPSLGGAAPTAASTAAPSAAQTALQMLAGGTAASSATPAGIALATLRNVRKQIAALTGTTPTTTGPTRSKTGAATGLALLSGTAAAGSIIDSVV